MLSDTVSIDQKTRLVQIAEGCPDTEGFDVYSARVLLSIIDPEVIYYTNDCEDPGLLRNAKPVEKTSEIKLYPNPANDKIFVTKELDGDYYLILYDYTGRIVFEHQLTNHEIDINHLKEGFYLYRIISDNKQITTGKVIVNR